MPVRQEEVDLCFLLCLEIDENKICLPCKGVKFALWTNFCFMKGKINCGEVRFLFNALGEIGPFRKYCSVVCIIRSFLETLLFQWTQL